MVVLHFSKPEEKRAVSDGVAAYDREDYSTALRVLKPLAKKGHAEAQFSLGEMYYDGDGVTEDITEAVKWYRKAADQGLEAAQYNLEVMSRDGQAVPQDYTEAAKWYREAAEQGDSCAQYHLGLMYHNGQGVTQDYVLAHMWLNLAAAQGDSDAKKLRDDTAKLMTRSQIAEAQRLACRAETQEPICASRNRVAPAR